MPRDRGGAIGIASRLELAIVPGAYAVCRLGADVALPTWATRGRFFSVTRTADELSVVCESEAVPSGVHMEDGWRAVAVRGPLAFDLTGVLAALAVPLAAARIGIFALSTYDTDYVLLRDRDLERAVVALREAGHNVSDG